MGRCGVAVRRGGVGEAGRESPKVFERGRVGRQPMCMGCVFECRQLMHSLCEGEWGGVGCRLWGASTVCHWLGCHRRLVDCGCWR